MDQPVLCRRCAPHAHRGFRAALLSLIMLAMLLCNACQAAVPAQLEATTAGEAAARTTPAVHPSRTPTLAPFQEPADFQPPASPRPSPTLQPTPAFEELGCEVQGRYARCTDDVLGIAFEYPAAWGEIEALLATAYGGYAYYYSYGAPQTDTYPLTAGGRSKGFSPPRGQSPTDFDGLADAPSPHLCPSSGAPRVLCGQVKPGVLWTVDFPDGLSFCAGLSQDRLAAATFQPVVRILVDLPENPTISGFVFQAPFLSKHLSQELDAELLPILGLGSALQVQGCPTPPWPSAARAPCVPSDSRKCDDASWQAFDSRVQAFIERFKSGALDAGTLENLDDLMHLATSISFTEGPGG